jgi:hypothetical protein
VGNDRLPRLPHGGGKEIDAMSRRRPLLGLLFVLVSMGALLLGPAASARPTALFAGLRGAREVPGPGDPDAKGRALIGVAVKQQRLCWALRVRNIELPATAAHIHAGRPDVAGPIVVPLGAPDETGVSVGCAQGLDRGLLRDIKRHPRRYYVNVHNEPYPAGALRGQLRVLIAPSAAGRRIEAAA